MSPSNLGKSKNEFYLSIFFYKTIYVLWCRYLLRYASPGLFSGIYTEVSRYLYARVGGKPQIRKGYKGEADYFEVYSPDTSKIYLVSVDDVPIGSKAILRLNATKNNQQKGVKWAQDYGI